MDTRKSRSGIFMSVIVLLGMLAGTALAPFPPGAVAGPAVASSAAAPGGSAAQPGNPEQNADLQPPGKPILSRWACTPPVLDGAAHYLEWGTAPSFSFSHGKISFLNDETHLYILVDVTGDTVDDSPPLALPDFSWVSFDVNGDYTITPNIDVNYGQFPGTFDIGLMYYLGPATWTGITGTASLLGAGFDSSPASPVHHRIWEYGILLSEIGAGPGSMVRTGIRAYSPNPAIDDYLPPDFDLDFTNLVAVQLAETPCSIQLAKRVFPAGGMANPGDILTYEIDYVLSAGMTYTNVIISDPVLSPDVTYLPGSANPPATYVGGVLTWHLGDLPGGSNGAVRFQVVVNPEACRRQGVVFNAAQLATDSPPQQTSSNIVANEVRCRPVEFPPAHDPPYAESEITVHPYPLVVGQLTRICTTIVNPDAVSHTVNVSFDLANFGIGLPFTPIAAAGNPRTVVIPPGGSVTVCIFWHPVTPGHQCVQVVVTDVEQQFLPLRSQRNLDVAEALVPGQPATFVFPVVNNGASDAMIIMLVRNNCAGWTVALDPRLFQLAMGAQQNVTVTVTPALTATLGSGCTIDIEAWVIDPKTGALERLIGGIRKIDQPPVPPSDPGEPTFAEREIRIYPYPLVSGAVTHICTYLVNNTDVSQTVTVEFQLSTLGIGLAFNTIPSISGPNPRTVVIPPHSTINVCIAFVPSTPGHHCLAIKLTTPDGYVTYSRQNLDVAEVLEPGVPTDVPVPVANPTAATADIDLVVDNTCPGWTAVVSPTTFFGVGPNSTDVRTAIMTVIPPAGPLGSNCHIDLLAYINGVLIGGVRKIDRQPPAPTPSEPPYAEREITVDPDPPVVGQSTQVCVTLYNPTNVTQTVDVTFAYADFGAGINFTDIQTVPGVQIPPNGSQVVCITWVPAQGGTLHRCLRIKLQQQGYLDLFSQRNVNLVRIDPDWFRVPTYELALPPFLLHNPLPDPAPIQLYPEVVGLAGFMLPEIMDAKSGEMFEFGQEIPFEGGQTRELVLVLKGETGVQQVTAPQFIGDNSFIDVLPYQNGQRMTVDGLPSGLRTNLGTAFHIYLPVIYRATAGG